MGANEKKEATFHPDGQGLPEYVENQPPNTHDPETGSRLKERAPGLYTSDEFEEEHRPAIGRIGKPEFRTLDKIIKDQGISGVIDKLIAPPESLMEHAKRLGFEMVTHQVQVERGLGVTLVNTFSIVGKVDDLLRAERGHEDGE